MPIFAISLNQRLQGLLFTTRYYMQAENAENVIAKYNALHSLRAAIQTPDVEYLNCTAINQEENVAMPFNVPFTETRGQYDGHTAPPANFLCFRLDLAGRRPASQRLRGYAVTELTEDGIFNIYDAGDTDPAEADTGGTVTTTASEYGLALVSYLGGHITAGICDAAGKLVIGFSPRVSTSAKQIRRVV